MNIKTLGIVSALSIVAATQAFAADVTGSVDLDVTENAAGDFVATPGIEMGIEGGVGVGSIGIVVDNATDALKLDSYSVGVKIGTDTVLSFGDQGDLMDGFEGATEVVGGTTLTNLDDSGESLSATMGNMAVALRFTDIGTDVTDIDAVQATYGTTIGILSLNAGVDYNLDTEDATTFAAASAEVAPGLTAGGTMSYDDKFAYELNAGYDMFGAFLNGDEDDALQNVGGGIYKSVDGTGMSFYAEAGYNVDSEEITPAAGVSFNF